ncbi:MAG: rhomboid family intramembrane serine protease [Ruminococcaceae bacterium]|nr:rhomboid family intramembrane serine protease [Oscillospiraceae bacterium]MBQ3215453.1 hypothetical protein [Oscillospiraceae bacterium]
MKKLRNRFERFCFQNRNWGIPNLMLYIVLGNAVVYLLSMINNSSTLHLALCFDRDAILHGQVWRLVTFVFTSVFSYRNPLFVIIGLYCYYSLGRAIENSWGTLRFNLFYATGIVLMDVFAMIFGSPSIRYGGLSIPMGFTFYLDMGNYLNLSLLIAFATVHPDARFLLFYIIPVKAWILALFYLGITVYQVVDYATVLTSFIHCLFPLVALLNYFLFFGKDVLNVFPFLRRRRIPKPKKSRQTVQYKTVTFHQKADFSHRCTICGRTDVSDPQLEFRYCSRCSGYHCYCEDHISSHTHIE